MTSVSISRYFETDNANSPGGTSARGSSFHDKPNGASQPAALGGQEFPIPHLSRSSERDNTSTLVSALADPSSQNQLPGLTGTGHLGGPRPAPSSDAMQGGLDYRYTDFPWTDEPQTMLTPSLSIPKLTKASEMDDKTTPGNRLKQSSRSTLTGGGKEEIQRGSEYECVGLSRAAESRNVPIPTPSTQSRPPPSPRHSEYTAMVLAIDDISVDSDLSSILINANALHLRLVV